MGSMAWAGSQHYAGEASEGLASLLCGVLCAGLEELLPASLQVLCLILSNALWGQSAQPQESNQLPKPEQAPCGGSLLQNFDSSEVETLAGSDDSLSGGACFSSDWVRHRGLTWGYLEGGETNLTCGFSTPKIPIYKLHITISLLFILCWKTTLLRKIGQDMQMWQLWNPCESWKHTGHEGKCF